MLCQFRGIALKSCNWSIGGDCELTSSLNEPMSEILLS
jgi:hypothetical protein